MIYLVSLQADIDKKAMDTQKTTVNETVIQQLLAAYGGEKHLLDELLKMDKKSKNPIINKNWIAKLIN